MIRRLTNRGKYDKFLTVRFTERCSDMKEKLNKPLLIISIAVAVFIIGISVFTTVYLDSPVGIFCGVGAFVLLIAVLLIENILHRKK